jgi:hypothetical protein
MWLGRETSCTALAPKSKGCIRSVRSCRKLVDDLWVLADRFATELDELVGCRTPV